MFSLRWADRPGPSDLPAGRVCQQKTVRKIGDGGERFTATRLIMCATVRISRPEQRDDVWQRRSCRSCSWFIVSSRRAGRFREEAAKLQSGGKRRINEETRKNRFSFKNSFLLLVRANTHQHSCPSIFVGTYMDIT